MNSGGAPMGAVRKVRASQGRIPANGRPRRLEGKCNREIPPPYHRGFPRRTTARVERRGKSPPECRRLHCHVNPIRSNISWNNAAARRVPKDGSSRAATRGLDRSLFTTEPGLQIRFLQKVKKPLLRRGFFICSIAATPYKIGTSNGQTSKSTAAALSKQTPQKRPIF